MEMRVPSAVLEARHIPATEPYAAGIALSFSSQLRVHYDKDTHALWSRWAPEPRPCFNPALLADIRSYYDFISTSGGRIDCLGEEHDIEYVVLASANCSETYADDGVLVARSGSVKLPERLEISRKGVPAGHPAADDPTTSR